MSNPNPIKISGTVLLVCCTAVFVFGASAAVAIFVAAPEGANTGSLIALTMASVPATIASLVGVAKLGGVQDKLEDVAQDTNRLANGLGQAKFRSAVADVVRDDLIDPTARPQLEADRAYVERHHREQEQEATS